MTDFIAVPRNEPLDAPLTGLEQVIEAAMADKTHWRAFEALLPTVDLFVVPEGATLAAIQPGDTGMRTLRPDQTLDLRGVQLDDGTAAAAVFTDPRRLQSLWGEDTVFIAMNAWRLLTLFRDRPVLLNPGSPRVMLLGIDDVAALLAAAEALAPVAGDVSRPTGTVQLGLPQQEPTVLIDRLKSALGPVGGTGITAAWLARAHWAEANRWGWLLDVRTDRPMDEVRAMVGRAVTGVAFGQDTLDVSVETAGGKDGVGVRVV